MKYCFLLLSMECSLTRGLTKDKFGSWNMNNVTEDQDVFEGGTHGNIFRNWKHYQAEGCPILELSVPHLVRFLLVSNLTEPIQVNDFLLNSCLNHCDNFLWMLLWRLNNHKRKWNNHLVSFGGTSVIRVLEGSGVITWEAPVEYENGQYQPGEPETPPPQYGNALSESRTLGEWWGRAAFLAKSVTLTQSQMSQPDCLQVPSHPENVPSRQKWIKWLFWWSCPLWTLSTRRPCQHLDCYLHVIDGTSIWLLLTWTGRNTWLS